MIGAFDEIDSEETFDRKLIARTVKWIEEDIFNWDCPPGNGDEIIDFFHCIGWQFFKYIRETVGCSICQARIILNQLYFFWMDYRTQKRPNTATYLLTRNRIEIFSRNLGGICAVGFLQAVYHFADFLFVHDRIDEKTRDDFRDFCTKLYTGTFASIYECYTADELISNFPFIDSIEGFRL